MSARITATSLGSSRNGMPDQVPYVWRGDPTKQDPGTAPLSGVARTANAAKTIRYERFCELRNRGLTVAEAAAGVGVGPQAAGRYERARLDAMTAGGERS